MTCTCGAQVDVPTLLELKRLQRVEPSEPRRPVRRWGLREQVTAAGGLIATAALAVAVYLAATLPPGAFNDHDRAMLRERVEQMTLSDTMVEWDLLRNSPPPEELPPYQQVRFARRYMRVALVWLAAGFSLLGMAVCVAGRLIPTTPRGRRSRGPQSRSPGPTGRGPG